MRAPVIPFNQATAASVSEPAIARLSSQFPGFGIESTADTIGTAVGVATLAGVAAHQHTQAQRDCESTLNEKES